ncbi:MAG: anaerobic ribonucleoside-triphosphate reductase activating protein [Dissulfurispiraceae bacterium]|jgi:pyruvate formate lyase activating enzyme|nr:anaerobic ribonucleoside-triphosphate reductase activating protein [Dissulfurispiraceae bacterium]
MRIGGFRKLSLVDYPGKLSAVVFTQGCNFRCSYCHNKELVFPDLFTPPISSEEILSFLDRRRGRIEGVVITGGEPLEQQGLEDFTGAVKAMGYALKLDTNGSYPAKFEKLLSMGVLDYIAMDYKAPAEKYPVVTGNGADADSVQKTLKILVRCGLPYEVRTTLFNGFTQEDVIQIVKELENAGVKSYYLQMPGGNSRLSSTGMAESDLISLFKEHCGSFHFCGIRNNQHNKQMELLTKQRRNNC